MPAWALARSGNGAPVPSTRKPAEGWSLFGHWSIYTRHGSPRPVDPRRGTSHCSGVPQVSGGQLHSLSCSWWPQLQGQRSTRRSRARQPSRRGTCSRRRRRRGSSTGSPSRCRTQLGQAWCQWSSCSLTPTRRTWWSRPSAVLQTPRRRRRNRAARSSANNIHLSTNNYDIK